ncbi:MAG: cellulose synthase family protein [Flavobacteriales bacterium]
MEILIWFLIIIYGAMLLFIFLYVLAQVSLVMNYRKVKHETNFPELEDFPQVTIQLPVYNEKYVVERLIQAVSEIDYPKDKMEIQVLDDSDDETVEIIDNVAILARENGIDIQVVRRPVREGYKAGALGYGLKFCKGEFVAIFDADFIPKEDFLKKTLPFFKEPKIGMVQTKWEHLNKNFSFLTQLQAFGLDAHFSIEQSGRNMEGHFINFNGTAGIWRKETIADAGGWQSDTLTEDLDLSYRAQLKGWKFKYLENVGSPAELPAVMNAIKTQQYRWTKGGAECAVKNLPKVFDSKELGWKTKMFASFHLLNSLVFVCILLTGVLSLPMLYIKNSFPQFDFIFQMVSVFTLSFFFLAIFYWTSQKEELKKRKLPILSFLIEFPLFISIYMGLSLHNAIAVIEGYLGRKTPFVRTPKFNLVDKKDKWEGNKYIRKHVNPLTYVEILLALYFAGAIGLGIYVKDFSLLPFHFMLSAGFATVAIFSFLHSHRS